jgi:hypothetical protein
MTWTIPASDPGINRNCCPSSAAGRRELQQALGLRGGNRGFTLLASREVAMAKDTDEARVVELFEGLRRAMLANDVGPLAAAVADDYQGSDAGGHVHDRDGFLQAYGPGGVELELFDVEDLEATSWSDTVLVRGRARIRGRYGEIEFAHHLRFLDVYACRDGEWKLVASQVCDIAS